MSDKAKGREHIAAAKKTSRPEQLLGQSELAPVRLLCTVLDEKRPNDQLGGMETLRELLQYWQKENYKADGMEMEQAVNDLRCSARRITLRVSRPRPKRYEREAKSRGRAQRKGG